VTTLQDAENLLRKFLKHDESKYQDYKNRIAVRIYTELNKKRVEIGKKKLDAEKLHELSHLVADRFLIDFVKSKS